MVTTAAPLDLTHELPAARTLAAADLDGLVEELAAYHGHFAPLFRRPEQRAWAGVYLGYASRRGYTLLDRRLYLPAA